jgi:hypothetical protein
MSPLSALLVGLLLVLMVGQVFGLSTLQHGQIKGSLRIVDGVSALPM